MVKVYTPSGKYNASLFNYTALVSVLLFAAGAVYQFVVSWIPLIYFDLLITLGIGAAVFAVAAAIVRKSKCRNRPLAMLCGAVLGIATLAGSHYWCFYEMNSKLAAIAAEDADAANEPVQVQELSIQQYIAYRTAIGWSVSSHGSSSGTAIKGVGVYIVWLIEALLVLAFAVYGAYDQVRSPFCERCDDWNGTPQVAVNRKSSVEKAAAKVKEAKTSDDLLLTLPLCGEGETVASFLYTVSKCQRCADLDTLTVEMVYEKKNLKGKAETKRKKLWRHVLLSRSQTTVFEAEKTASA